MTSHFLPNLDSTHITSITDASSDFALSRLRTHFRTIAEGASLATAESEEVIALCLTSDSAKVLLLLDTQLLLLTKELSSSNAILYLPLLKAISYVLHSGTSLQEQMVAAASVGREDIMRGLYYTVSEASLFGNRDTQFGSTIPPATATADDEIASRLWSEQVYLKAIENDHLRCLQFAHVHGCPWSEDVCTEAANYRRHDCLWYAIQNGCPIPTGFVRCKGLPQGIRNSFFTTLLAAAGYLDIIKYIREAHESSHPNTKEAVVAWSSSTCSSAAAGGHLECLHYLHEQGCKWDESTCAEAARGAHLDCLKYAHEQGCPWDEATTAAAAEAGGMDCLSFAHRHGCPISVETCRLAARKGHLPCLQYAFENSEHSSSGDSPDGDGSCWSWDESICIAAARVGSVDCLRYAHEHGAPWCTTVCHYAARHADAQCLRYAHENDCPWDALVCSIAAQCGNLACLQYAHEHGCPWNELTCMETARAGNLLCLQYAHEHGCPLALATVWNAARHGHAACLQYAFRGCPNLCPFDVSITYRAAEIGAVGDCIAICDALVKAKQQHKRQLAKSQAGASGGGGGGQPVP